MKTTRSLAFLFLAAGFTAASAQTYTFTTPAGTAGRIGSADGTGSAARFFSPYGVAVDGSGNVFVADLENSTVRKITASGVVTTLAGTASSSGGTDGARIDSPSGVAVDASGNLFVTDQYAQMIFKLGADGVVTHLAGQSQLNDDFGYRLVGGSNDGTGSEARFSGPSGVAVDGSGNVFVADSGNHAIRKITASGVVTTLAGSAGSPGSNDGTRSEARFAWPSGVAVDGSGNVFVADAGNYAIRKITAAGVVTTLAGTAGSIGSADGTGSAARFSDLGGVAVDGNGNVFVADSWNHTIRKITASGVVTTLASPIGSIGSEDGTGNVARFYSPYGVAVDASGNLFVADTGNHTIRMGVPDVTPRFAVTAPQSQHINIGAGATFTVVPAGSGFSYQWKKDGAAIAGTTSSTYQITSAAAGDMGFYSVVVGDAAATIESPIAILTVATGGTSRLSNLSARALVSGDRELVVGFVVRGSRNKSLLVRAIGPTLGSLGVRGVLSDPNLDVVSGGASRAVLSNNDWAGGPMLVEAFADVGAFPLPSASKDAAVLATFDVGTYTARVTSSGADASGIALAEVYDRDPASAPSRLVNISALGLVQPAAPALAFGFVIEGAAPKQLLIRAVGPGLAPLDVAGVLADPNISIIPLGKTFTVASNDNWGGDAALAGAFASAGAFALPASSKDAAVVVRLPPGGYTVTVSGVPYTSGRALVEIYDLDP